MRVSPASEKDVSFLMEILAAHRNEPSLLWRSEQEIKENIASFVVAKTADDRVAGCAALHRHVHGAAEIMSVAVSPLFQGQGIGALLVHACERKARELGCAQVWLVTTKPDYYRGLGYAPFSPFELPILVLAWKARQAFGQPVARWLGLFLARFAYMKKRISCAAGSQPTPFKRTGESEA